MPLPMNDPRDLPSLIDFNRVSFSYPGTPVLHQVSFQVRQGEFIGMIGPNGGGKTTLLKLILGFLKPTDGKIRIFGEKAGGHWGALNRLAYVPQSVRFDREFPISVEEVVLSGLISQLPWFGRFRAADRQAAQEAIDYMGLSSVSHNAFGTLSGGQAQRALIARALISKPQLLLLDEPTASVDVQAESDIYSILNQLKGKMTILMVTHDLRAAIEQVDRVLCVQSGVISLKPEEVCKHFAFGLYHMPLIQPQQSLS